MIWLVNLIRVGDCKAIVLIEHYRLDIYLLSAIWAIFLSKRFGQRYWQMIECGNGMLWQAQGWVF